MNNTLVRILTAAVGIPVAIGLLVLGGIWWTVAVCAIAIIGLIEFYSLAKQKGYHPNTMLGVAGGLACLVAMALIELDVLPSSDIFSVMSYFFFMSAVLTAGTEVFRNKPNALANVSATLFGFLYVLVPFVCLIILRSTEHGNRDRFGLDNAEFVGMLFVAMWIADSAAYFAGRQFGRHKILERVSPKKTWEGAIAGALCAVGATIAAVVLLGDSRYIGEAVGMGLIVGACGPLGDFAESLLKRDAGVKDSGAILPGHGGVLDRFDSMMFAAPLTMFYLSIIQ